MRSLALACALLSVGAGAGGCWDVSDEFVCGDDSQCNRLPGGRCEPAPDRYCSYSDTTCTTTGQRYSSHARSALRDQCVPATDAAMPLDGGGSDLATVSDLAIEMPSPDLAVDAAMPPTDLAVDAAMKPPDLAVDAAQPPSDLAPPCPRPWLLVSAADFESGGAGHTPIGNVLRFAIGAGGTLTSCAPFDGNGSFGALMTTLAAVPPNSIAVGSRDSGYQLFDLDQNLFTGSYPISSFTFDSSPIDVFPMRALNGDQLVMYAAAQVGGAGSPISDVYAFKGSTLVQHFSENNDLQLSISYSMTASPLDAKHLFATSVSTADRAAMDSNPWTAPATNMLYLTNMFTDQLYTLYSLLVGAIRRSVWVGKGNSLYFADDSGTPSMLGPVKCNNPAPPMACTLEHAVPDPTTAGRMFAVCSYVSGAQFNSVYILRMGGNSCQVLFDGGASLTQFRNMNRLAVAQ